MKRPTVDPEHTVTVGLSREEARAVVAAADADTGTEPRQSSHVSFAVRLPLGLQSHAVRVHTLEQADSGAEQHG